MPGTKEVLSRDLLIGKHNHKGGTAGKRTHPRGSDICGRELDLGRKRLQRREGRESRGKRLQKSRQSDCQKLLSQQSLDDCKTLAKG